MYDHCCVASFSRTEILPRAQLAQLTGHENYPNELLVHSDWLDLVI